MNDAIIELEAYQQALLEAEKVGDFKEICQAKANLSLAFYSTGKLDEALRIIDEAIEIAEQENDKTSLASYLGKRGVILFESDDFIKAQECFLRVLDFAEEIGNNAYKCDALGNLGLILASTGDPAGSMEKLNEALSVARQMGDSSRELTQLGNVGHTYLQVANIEDAIKTYTLAVQIAKKIGDRKSEAGYLNNLGVLYNNISQYDSLIKVFEQVLKISTEVDDKKLESNALQYLTKGCFAKGDTALAIQYARRALELMNELETPADPSPIKDILITCLIKEERFSDALDEIKKELDNVRFEKNKERELVLLGQFADTFYQIGELDKSLDAYQLALNLSVRLQRKILEGRLAGRLGAIYADLGERERSNQYIDRAIQVAEKEKDLQTLAEQYFLRALNYKETGQTNEAINDCHKSIGIFNKIGLIAQEQQAQNLLTELQTK
ncbi:MAG TPA: tetratricopeptide repeat protein [Anaerolineae bacterium]|nr:tetratricopeptide repeat protein [Anaerolineae bacterium]